jgi:4-hydroxyphenylacetate decarboxylase small subunit
MDNTCKDCKFYLPVDVFKGICKQDKKQIAPDDPSCELFEMLPKCKFCASYISEKEYLGKCNQTTLTYPDLNASKCTSFEWFNQN